MNEIEVYILQHIGYSTIFIIMILESLPIPQPMPTEVFLIILGHAVAKSKDLSLLKSIACSNAGVIVASLATYYVARKLGRNKIFKLVKKFPKIQQKLISAEEFLTHNWQKILFFCRFIPLPGMKHFIAIPCGLIKCNILQFVLITILGSTLLNIIWISVGYFFGIEIAKFIEHYIRQITFVVLISGILYKKYNSVIKKKLKKLTQLLIQKK